MSYHNGDKRNRKKVQGGKEKKQKIRKLYRNAIGK
jgi:hypothetical protein